MSERVAYLYPAMIDVGWLLMHPRVKLSAFTRARLEDELARRIRKKADGKRKENRPKSRKHHVSKRRTLREVQYRYANTPRGWLAMKRKDAKAGRGGSVDALTPERLEAWLVAEMKKLGVRKMAQIRLVRLDPTKPWTLENMRVQKRKRPRKEAKYQKRLKLRALAKSVVD